MEWESDSHCRSHTYARQKRRSPGRGSGWELEFRDWGAILVWGLLLTAERQMEGRWGRRLWWEMPLEESQAACKQGNTAESHLGGGAITIASLSTCQHPQLNNREAGPSNAWLTELRVGPQLGAPSVCLTCWATEKDQAREPSKGLNGRSYRGRLPKGPSDRQLQEARKKTLIGPWLLRRRQSVSLHTWCCQGHHKPSSCANFMLNSHRGRTATGKNSPVSTHRVTLVLSGPLQPSGLWPARLLCQGGASPGKNTAAYWPLLVAMCS